MTDKARFADKIAKLIAKADSSTHPEEAELFMAKAQELMVSHGLNLMDLGRLSEDPLDVSAHGVSHSKSYMFMTKVASALCNYYGCKFVRFNRGNKVVYDVIGRESARVTFMLMMPFVHRQIMDLGRKGYNAGHYTSRMQAVTRIGNAVAKRVWSMVPETAKHEGNGVNALVPVDLIDQLMAEAYPDVRKPRRTKSTTDSASVKAAEQVSINRQAHGASVKRLSK